MYLKNDNDPDISMYDRYCKENQKEKKEESQ